jgi:hypothetical protein
LFITLEPEIHLPGQSHLTDRKIVNYIVLSFDGNPNAEFGETMTPGIENRLHPRMPIASPARMVTTIGVMEGEMENVSLHGGFIRCQKPLEPGDRLFVIVNFPSNLSFNSYAEVVWSRVPRPNHEGTSPGMGVKFLVLTQTSHELETRPKETVELERAVTF